MDIDPKHPTLDMDIAPTRTRRQDERGFTLIELLVVILIIGILAAIAIPSFLSQKSKSTDASAKELARTAQTTVETYATDHNGEYNWGSEGLKVLHEYEPTIQTAAGSGNAYLSVATGGSNTYTVTASSVTPGHTFTIKRETNGEIKRTCAATGTTVAEKGGCPNGTW